MKTIIYSCLSILLLYMTYRYCIELKSHNITKLNYKTYVIKSSNVNDSFLQMEIEKSSDWCRFIEALIQIESRGVENAVGDNGKSVGVLQIQTVYIDECNIYTSWSY